jgi:hypothetical protein
LRVILYRSKLADGSFDYINSLDQDVSSTATRKGINHKIDSTANVVDNQNYLYSVGLCLKSQVPLYYVGGRITYTYTTAGD